MKFNRQDWVKLRLPIVGLALSLMAMTLLVGYAEKRNNESAQALQAQNNQLNQARQRYLTSGQEKQNIVTFLPPYQKLISDGFVGEEHRIEWVDSLRTIHQQHKFFNIKYSIGKQEEYKPAFALNVGAFKLHRSVMRLELAMLHEGDLLTLIEALSTEQASPFILRQCEIVRQSAIIANTLTPNMLASCELDWITIHEPQAAGT
jgi:hypothetical protein